MTDRPIIFSGPMVRALLDGRKTQTRRLFRPRGFEFYTHPISGDRYNQYHPYRDGTWDDSRIVGSGPMQPFGWGEHLYSYLPYAPGDRLIVRENYRLDVAYDEMKARDVSPQAAVWFADGEKIGDGVPGKLRPSIFLPRWASRLTLVVEDVRVERLQAITEADARAEGARYTDFGKYQPPGTASLDGGRTWHAFKPRQHPGWHMLDVDRPEQCLGSPESAFANLWNHLHGEGAWSANPFVVAVTFRVERGNIDRLAA